MLVILCAILLAVIITRCVDQSGLSPIGQILLLVLIVIILGGLTVGFPETVRPLRLQ